MAELTDHQKLVRQNTRSAFLGLSVVAGMLALGYASVPLYNLFCRVTGYGGTTQIATAESVSNVRVADKIVSIRFDSNTAPGMLWSFEPEHTTDKVSLGARDMAIFIATNNSDKPVTGTASYNVSPQAAGKYFNKIQCFCFTEQTLQAGETVRMPVLYYVDPAIQNDPDADYIEEITLSYTFYPVDPEKKGG